MNYFKKVKSAQKRVLQSGWISVPKVAETAKAEEALKIDKNMRLENQKPDILFRFQEGLLQVVPYERDFTDEEVESLNQCVVPISWRDRVPQNWIDEMEKAMRLDKQKKDQLLLCSNSDTNPQPQSSEPQTLAS